MSWNFSRIKIFVLGLMGSGMSIVSILRVVSIMPQFTMFERLMLCFSMCILLLISVFLVYWGLEPIMPDISMPNINFTKLKNILITKCED